MKSAPSSIVIVENIKPYAELLKYTFNWGKYHVLGCYEHEDAKNPAVFPGQAKIGIVSYELRYPETSETINHLVSNYSIKMILSVTSLKRLPIDRFIAMGIRGLFLKEDTPTRKLLEIVKAVEQNDQVFPKHLVP